MLLVIKLGGAVAADADQVRILAGELKAIAAAGHQAILVHGAGPQLDVALRAIGEKPRKVDGLRVTTPAAAGVVADTMDDIGDQLAKALRGHGLECAHVSWTEGTFPSVVKAQTLERVGTATLFKPPAGLAGIAVVTPVGFDEEGPLNLNADEGAAAVASSLLADCLVLATDVDAVRDADGKPIARMDQAEAVRLIGTAATGGMIPKIQNAVRALESGVRRVAIIRLEQGAVVNLTQGQQRGGTILEATVR